VHALLYNVFYKVYYTIHRTLLYLSSPFLCECTSIALHCILQSIVLCTLYSTLSSLLSGSLSDCACIALRCILQHYILYTVVYSLSRLRFSVRVRVCIALLCILRSIVYCTLYSSLSLSLSHRAGVRALLRFVCCGFGAMAMASLTARVFAGNANHVQALHALSLPQVLTSR